MYIVGLNNDERISAFGHLKKKQKSS